MTSAWGPSTWLFMHTLAAKIKDTSFPLIGPNLIAILINICNNMPCPHCTTHTKAFWSNVNTSNIKSKTDVINLLFVLHNMVNQRKHTVAIKYENLEYYNTTNLINTYNLFTKNFNTRGNMNLINEAFHRNLMMSSLKKWMLTNINHFNL